MLRVVVVALIKTCCFNEKSEIRVKLLRLHNVTCRDFYCIIIVSFMIHYNPIPSILFFSLYKKPELLRDEVVFPRSVIDWLCKRDR